MPRRPSSDYWNQFEYGCVWENLLWLTKVELNRYCDAFVSVWEPSIDPNHTLSRALQSATVMDGVRVSWFCLLWTIWRCIDENIVVLCSPFIPAFILSHWIFINILFLWWWLKIMRTHMYWLFFVLFFFYKRL